MVSVECEIPCSGSERVSEFDESPPDWCHPAKLFIGGLPRHTSTQQLKDHFSKHGRVVDCVVMRWSDGRSRGFGYITYDNADAANEALKNPQPLDGRAIDVKRAVPGTNKLFVGGLPQGVAAAELRTYFSNFGPVSDAVVMMDSTTGRSRGFGFVCFAPGPQGACAVSAALANYDQHQLRGKWIEVKSAAPPQELNKASGDSPASVSTYAPPELLLPPSTPSSLQSAPITPCMSHFSTSPSMASYTQQNPLLSSPHSLLQHRGVPMSPMSMMMSPNAPEFVPNASEMPYGHLMQADPYAQQQMPMALYPGGRPIATPHSDRNIAEIDMQKPPLDPRAFSAVRSMDQDASMVPPPPQHEPGEPQWPVLPLETSAPPAVPMLPSPPDGLPGDVAPGFAIARGFGMADAESEQTPSPIVATASISPATVVTRLPPGLEDQAAMMSADQYQPVMKDMCIQTDGPACTACGAAFGCASKCPWSRNQLLGLREAFLRTEAEPKDSSALKAVRHQEVSTGKHPQVGGA